MVCKTSISYVSTYVIYSCPLVFAGDWLQDPFGYQKTQMLKSLTVGFCICGCRIRGCGGLIVCYIVYMYVTCNMYICKLIYVCIY